MKNSKAILSAITSQSQFHSLVQHGCYQKFMALLPPRFQKAIAFVYIKKDTLFVALSHPGYKMELNYNKDLFKSLLYSLSDNAPECAEYTAKDVILFNSKFTQIEKGVDMDTTPYYNELSSGKFEMNIYDDNLREKFKASKRLIASNRDRE